MAEKALIPKEWGLLLWIKALLELFAALPAMLGIGVIHFAAARAFLRQGRAAVIAITGAFLVEGSALGADRSFVGGG